MQVFRIANTKHIRDLSGTGARLYGGRWNEEGVAVVYASESRALATVEYLVHVPAAIRPTDISLVCLSIPGRIMPKEIRVSDLPANWRSYPGPPELAEIGTEWVASNASLLLRVPSAVVDDEFNILIGPGHPDIRRVKIAEVKKYQIDQRLLRDISHP